MWDRGIFKRLIGSTLLRQIPLLWRLIWSDKEKRRSKDDHIVNFELLIDTVMVLFTMPLTRCSANTDGSNELPSETSWLAFSFPRSVATTRSWASRAASLVCFTAGQQREASLFQRFELWHGDDCLLLACEPRYKLSLEFWNRDKSDWLYHFVI